VTFQDRTILLLEASKEASVTGKLLESSLGLVCELIKASFSMDPNENLLKYKSRLDDIKKKTAGIARTELLSNKGSTIATYAGHLFAFQQFFHSSYRARQGNVLEEVIRHVLSNVDGIVVAKRRDKELGKHAMLKKLFRLNKKLDVDILAKNRHSGECLIVQLRSADMTGGTTAKESLVDLGVELLEKKEIPKTLYAIFVWEPELNIQKQALINQIWERLKHKIGENFEKDFKENVEKGWETSGKKLKFKLIYGIDEFSEVIKDFTHKKEIGEDLKKVWNMLEDWDDLWLTYALTTLELENLIVQGFCNFQVLVEMLKKSGIDKNKINLKEYKSVSESLAQKLALEWDKDTLPVKTPSDMLNYIRDLILLWMIYERLSRYNWSITKLFSSQQEGALLGYLQEKH
jgi:hypothetical protein